MKKKRAAKNPIKIPRAKADDQPATRRMLKLVRDELKEEIAGKGEQVRADLKKDIYGLRVELKAEISELRDSMQKTNQMLDKTKQTLYETNQKTIQMIHETNQKTIQMIHETKQMVHESNQKSMQMLHETKQMVHETNQMAHGTKLLVEEQNANNRIVLEGLQALWQRQDRLEGKSEGHWE